MGFLEVFSILAVLSWWYLICLGILFICLTVSAYNESLGPAVFCTISLLIVSYFAGLIDIESINFVKLLLYISIYLFIGIIWSFFKYRLEVKNIINYTKDQYYIKYKDINELKDLIRQNIKFRIDNSRKSLWILFFPYSIIKFLIGDFIEYIVEKLGKVYTKISEYIINKELESL